MQFRGLCSVALLFVVAASLAAPSARAGANDLYLLGLIDENGTTDDEGFRKLTTELGIVMTPAAMQPAETTGQAGFDFGVDLSLNFISFQEDYWKNARVGTGLQNRPALVPTLETLAIRGRKGFILPIPLTSEIELGANWLIESRLVMLGSNFRLALNEGFRWIPDVAVNAGINRLVGSDDLDLTTVTAGASISKGFGIFGDFNLTPFFDYQSVFIDARTRIIDPDPSNTSDIGNTVTFKPIAMAEVTNNNFGQCLADVGTCLQVNRYDRFSLGLRLHVALVQLALGTDINYIPGNAFPLLIQTTARFGVLF